MQKISKVEFEKLNPIKKLETLNKVYKGEVKICNDKEFFDDIFPGLFNK